MKNNQTEKIIVFIDGGSRGNPGPSAIGVAIYNPKGDMLKSYSHYLGDTFTNNEAEYNALIFAFKKLKSLLGKKKIKNIELEVNSDSELLVKQMQGLYKITSLEIQKLFLESWNLKIDFKNVGFNAIPREKNKVADKLVNDALNQSQKLF